MAAGDSKGGSDLDVFEGLGKKTATRAPVSAPRASAPPPPPSLRPSAASGLKAVPPQTATMPSASASGAATAPAPRTPPPPPGRAALPPVVPPPSKAGMGTQSKAAAAPPPAQGNMSVKALSQPPPPMPPPAAKAGGGLDMDWDEDEEATHVLDRDNAKDALSAPNGGKASGAPIKQTLIGLSGGVPPGARPPSLPPPPPSAANAYVARPPSAPGFTTTPSVPAPPPASVRPAAPAPATPAPAASAPVQVQTLPSANGRASNFPYQASTTPLQMPPRTSARAKIEDAPAMPPRPNRMEATAVVRPKQSQTGLFALVGVAVVAAIGTVIYLMPRTGQIAINVADSKGGAVKGLQVSIDGKLQCDTAPCLVKELPAGSHTVKVEAAGYELPAEKAIAIESAKLAGVDFTLTAIAPSGGTGIKIAGSQPGEKLYVDDKEIGSLPQEIRDLAPGSHKVRVAAGDRYAAVEKTITLAKDEFQDLGAVTLKVVRGRATVLPGTPGAQVFLVTGSDKRELPKLPMSVDLDPAKQWSLIATKAGYSDFTQPLSFDDGQAEKSFTVTLEPKTANAPAAPALAFSPPPQSYSRPAAPAEPRAPREKPEPAPAAHEPAATVSGEGTLNLNSIPASSVVLDGKPIGTTPVIGFTVSAGTHKVVFINADQGTKKEVTVTVAAGETKKVHP